MLSSPPIMSPSRTADMSTETTLRSTRTCLSIFGHLCPDVANNEDEEEVKISW